MTARTEEELAITTDDQRGTALRDLEDALKRALAVASPEDVTRRLAMLLPGIRTQIGPEVLAEERRLALLDELAAELEAANGPVPEELIQEALREWPDYEEE